jgi:ferrous iron transport protein A
MTLDQLGLGQSAAILRLNLDPAHSAQLMEMGVFEGVRVTLIAKAPLGDPLEVQAGWR